MKVPASYGPSLGQTLFGKAPTILPGQGPRHAAFGMHERLNRDTLIQAHRNERVDISPFDHVKSNGIDERSFNKMIQLLQKLISQSSNFKIDFNVDGAKLASAASKNMGTNAYGDK